MFWETRRSQMKTSMGIWHFKIVDPHRGLCSIRAVHSTPLHGSPGMGLCRVWWVSVWWTQAPCHPDHQTKPGRIKQNVNREWWNKWWKRWLNSYRYGSLFCITLELVHELLTRLPWAYLVRSCLVTMFEYVWIYV